MSRPPEADEQTPALSRRLAARIIPWQKDAGSLVCALVGLAFLLAAAGMLLYSVAAVPSNIDRDGFAMAIVILINDLLLVVIIMEVLRTVVSYLKARMVTLRPFLLIAAISATRRIPAIGAETNVDRLPEYLFNRSMADLAADTAVILTIAIALYLLSRRQMTADDRI